MLSPFNNAICHHFFARKLLFISLVISTLSACHDHRALPKPDDINESASVSSVVISDTTQPGQSVTASYTFIDANSGKDISTYQWLIDDEVMGDTLSLTLPTDSEGKNLTFCVTPLSSATSTMPGATVCVEKVILGQYSPPTIEQLTLSSPIETGIEVTASYLFVDENNRAEGESIYRWAIDNMDFSTEKSITLPTDSANKMLMLCITPVAISGENSQGEETCTEQITITAKVGVPATVENLTITGVAKAGNEISLSYDFVDIEGDIEGDSLITWSIDGVEVSQNSTLTLPNDSSGKALSLCVTPISLTGIPTQGEETCLMKDIAQIIITGELELHKTINLEIKGYTYNGVTWRIMHPTYSPVRSTSDTEFIISPMDGTNSVTFLVANDIEVCIDTIEEGEICLSIGDQPVDQVTGGMPTEIDADNNVLTRTISPVSYVDLTISGVTKRLHRPLNVTESILLNDSSGGAVPLHTGNKLDNSPITDWALYDHDTAVNFCTANGQALPVQGVDDTSDPFGLKQYHEAINDLYPDYPIAPVARAMGWPDLYFRSISFESAGSHYDYYLALDDPSSIEDNVSEAIACISTVP